MFSKIGHGSLTVALVLFLFLSHVREKRKFAPLERLAGIFPPAIRGKHNRAITDC